MQNRTENAPLLRYVDSLRQHGHRAARIDPLDILQREEVAAVDPTRYGLVDEGKKYNINGIIWTQPLGPCPDYGLGDMDNSWWTLGDITRHLRSIYMGRVAYEYMHSPSKTERLWFSHFLESQTTNGTNIPKNVKKRIHSLLAKSETLDNFLQVKFPNLKRYGLEGGESMLPALDTLFNVASQGILVRSKSVQSTDWVNSGGIQHIILAMPHRGRLNLLTELLEFSPTALFHKIKGGSEIPEEFGAEGDVISHLGELFPVNVIILPVNRPFTEIPFGSGIPHTEL